MTSKGPRAAMILSMIAVAAWALFLQVEWDSMRTRESRTIYLPYAGSLHPLLASAPAAREISSSIFPGLYKMERQGRLIPLLASAPPTIDHRLEVTSKVPVQLPDGTKLSAVNASNYIAQILRSKKEETLKSIKIVQPSLDCVRFVFDPAVAVSEERLIETLAIKREDPRLEVRTIFTIGVDLRRDLKWDDAHPFTSEDVLFTYGLLRNMGGKSPLHYRLAFVEEIVAVGKDRIEIRCKSPSHLAIELCTVGILPKFYLDNESGTIPAVSTQSYIFRDNAIVTKGDESVRPVVFGQYPREGSFYRGNIPMSIAACFNLRSPKFYSLGRRRRLANVALNPSQDRRNLSDCAFEMIVDAENGEEVRQALLAADRWRKASATVTLRKVSHADYLRRLRSRDFEVLICAIPDISSIEPYPLFHSSQSSDGANIFGYTQSDRDKEILTLDRILAPKERDAAIIALMNEIVEDVPMIYIGPTAH